MSYRGYEQWKVRQQEEAANEARAAALASAASADLTGDLGKVLGVLWASVSLIVSVMSFQDCPATVCVLLPSEVEIEAGFSVTLLEDLTTRLPLLPLRAALCAAQPDLLPGVVVHAVLCGATLSTPLLALAYFLHALWCSVEGFADAAEQAEKAGRARRARKKQVKED